MFYFEAMLDGDQLEIIQKKPTKYKTIEPIHMKIIQNLITNKLQLQSAVSINPYARDCFAALCNKKELIILKREMIKEQYHIIADSILFSTEFQTMTTAPTTIDNLFRPYIFTLFPNLKEIRIEFQVSLWNFISLYSNLKEWKPTTKVLIKDNYSLSDRIIPTEYQTKIRSLFAANGLTATFTDDGPWTHNLVIIKSNGSSREVVVMNVEKEAERSMLHHL